MRPLACASRPITENDSDICVFTEWRMVRPCRMNGLKIWRTKLENRGEKQNTSGTGREKRKNELLKTERSS